MLASAMTLLWTRAGDRFMSSIIYTTLLIALGLLPSFVWLVFYTREDFRHPEPKRLIASTFFLGGLATFFVLPVQLLINRNLEALSVSQYSFTSFLALGFVEELFKFAVVYFFIHKTLAFDEPLHAMIYMIVSGLGFAAAENIASLYQAAGGSLFQVAVAETLTMRFVGATLLHSIASGIVGYFWALAFIKGSRSFVLKHGKEFSLVSIGLLTATVLHATFNYLIITSGPARFAILFLVIVTFILLHDFEKFKQEDFA